MARPSWDEYFMEMAHVAKRRSTCLSRQTGAVLVKDNRVVATGYNGTPSKTKHCIDGGCARCASRVNNVVVAGQALDQCACCHAEENAVVQAALHGISTKGTVMYTTYVPCTLCAKIIINAGIKKVITNEEYPDDLGKKLLAEASVELIKFRPSSS